MRIYVLLQRSRDLREAWLNLIWNSDILAEFLSAEEWYRTLGRPDDVSRLRRRPDAGDPSCLFAEISARSLLNRIHHAIFFTDSLTIYTGRAQDGASSASTFQLEPDGSLLRVCEELNRQLRTWLESLPEAIRPDLSGNDPGNVQACLMQLRYWSAKQNIYRPFVIFVTSPVCRSACCHSIFRAGNVRSLSFCLPHVHPYGRPSAIKENAVHVQYMPVVSTS